MRRLNEKIYRTGFSLIFAALFNIMYISKSLADIDDPFIQVTCAPHLEYISIRTFHIMDTGFEGDTIKSNVPVKSIDESGIYELRKFTTQDYKCDLPEKKLRIITNEFIKDERGKCSDDAKLTIISDDKEVYAFYAYGKCKGINHQIDIQYFPYFGPKGEGSFSIRDCEYPESDYSAPNIQPQCKTASFPSMSIEKSQK